MNKAMYQALTELLRFLKRRDYVCRYCGLHSMKPHAGSCPRSPHKKHEFIKASIGK